MSHYQHHIFFCLNQREPGDRDCCANHNATDLQEYAKKQVKTLGLNGPGKVRVNKAGCLDRCEHGPVCVVYPSGTWYKMLDHADVDEIVQSHLRDGVPVKRLMIDVE